MHTETRAAELKALAALRDAISLKVIGCRFDRGLTRGIAVTMDRRGHNGGWGAWWYEDGIYKFAADPSRAAQYTAQTPKDVVAKTMRMAVSHFKRNPI